MIKTYYQKLYTDSGIDHRLPATGNLIKCFARHGKSHQVVAFTRVWIGLEGAMLP